MFPSKDERYTTDDMIFVGYRVWRVTENSLHSPYEGLCLSGHPWEIYHIFDTQQLNAETPWPISLSYLRMDSLQSNYSKRVTLFIPTFDQMSKSLSPDHSYELAMYPRHLIVLARINSFLLRPHSLSIIANDIYTIHFGGFWMRLFKSWIWPCPSHKQVNMA